MIHERESVGGGGGIGIIKEIEVRNETNEPILVSACCSKVSGRLFVHIGKAHGGEVEVKPQYYAIIDVVWVET